MKRVGSLVLRYLLLLALVAVSAGGAYCPALAAVAGSGADVADGQASGAVVLTADEEQAVALLNADRAAHGLPPLPVNLTLVTLARTYAQDMIDRDFFSHTSPEGEAFTDRLARYGVSYRCAGENLGMNGSVAAAERMLMNSPGHRANILGPDYTEMGIGIRRGADGSVYVVQEFVGR